jgi:AcrR family transcriptional regulator
VTAAPAAPAAPREVLLAAVIEAIERHGLGSRSLRDLARDAGTSHRMLIHHFGSREGLLIAIVTAVEARTRTLLADRGASADDLLVATWEQVAEPSVWPFERLFFECYARGAQGEEPFDRLLPALVDDWLDAFPAGRARDQARLGLAVVRGLLLDLVATEDRSGVDRALREFRALLRGDGPVSGRGRRTGT